jgi:curli biogenesis system outer membrane secretion channel CsgG
MTPHETSGMTQRTWSAWYRRATRAAAVAALAALVSCASDKTRSGGPSDVHIASGEDRIARCTERIGAAAITEADTNAQALTSAGLPRSMAPLVRQLLMQTRCFAVLERGAAFAALEYEMRIREQQGQERNRQVAAMTAADYVLRAEIVFAEQTAGSKTGIGAAFGNLLGGLGAEYRTREALIVISAVDARTSEIIAASFGRGTNEAVGVGSVMLGGGLLALQGGWLDTPQAKPVAAALVDAWNQLLPRLLATRDKTERARMPVSEPVDAPPVKDTPAPAPGPAPVLEPEPAASISGVG